jgi:flagellar assembly factor FliW
MLNDRQEAPPGEALVAIATRDLGRKEVREDRIITFPWGLPGFADLRRYTLLEHPQVLPFLCLQCVEQPELAFAVIDPVKLVPAYRVGPIDHGILKDLAAEDSKELQVLVILTIPPGRPEEMTVNLMAPILINTRQNLGKQVVLEANQYSQRHRVFPA